MADNSIQGVAETIKTFAEKNIDVTMKRIPVKSTTINKMKKISSLFSDETGGDLKETEMIAFFFEMSFDAFMKSGVIENRIKSLTE